MIDEKANPRSQSVHRASASRVFDLGDSGKDDQPASGTIVSAVVPNFNGKAVLEACLNSLQNVKSFVDGLEIIVVDNGSSDGSRELVLRDFKSVKMVPLGMNEGFAAAVNVGVRASRGEFVAILNNDVEVATDWLVHLMNTLRNDESVAAATGKLLFKHEPKIVNDLGGTVLLSGSGFQRGLGTLDREMGKTTFVGVPTGAACLVRRKDFLETGGFDNSYFAYFEDVDLGWRLWQRGRKVAHVPLAVAYHEWRSTARRLGIEFRAYHGAKNSFANFVKNGQARYLPEAATLWMLRLLIQSIRCIEFGEAMAILAMLRAIAWCAGNLKRLLASRRRIQRRRTVSDAELVRLGVVGSLREFLTEAVRVSSIKRLAYQV